MTHSLALGDLTLTGSRDFPDEDHGFWFEIAAEGFEFGKPEAVTRIVTSLLADGAIVSYDSDGNRTINVRVRVHGPSLAAVAQGEAALRRASKRPNELTWQPPDEFAPVSAFETYPSPMTPVQETGWDLAEKWWKERTFALSLACSPHAMSADTTTISALVAGSTTTVVDTCDSAAGWSATTSGYPATASTAWEAGSVGVAELDEFVTSPEPWTLTRTGVIDFSTTPHLVVEVRTISSDSGRPLNLAGFSGSGISKDTRLPVLSMRRISGSVYFEVVFDMSAVLSVSALTFLHNSTAGDPWQGLFIRSVARTNIPPAVSPRQVSRILSPGGTERTPASIQIASANGTDSLGLTLVHTSPEDGSGYSPAMRRWRVSGNTVTTDASTVSGGYELLHPNPVGFEVPTSSLPEGGYLLCAFLRVGIVGDHSIYFSSYTQLPAPNDSTLMGEVINRVTVNFPVANTWQLVPLGIMTLPTVRTSAGQIIVGIQRDSASLDDILIDEAWLFRVDDNCALSIVDATASNLWLDSPGVGSPVPTVWMGDSPESRTHPGTQLVSPGNHVLHPDGTAVFVATLGTQWPEVSGTFRRRWHSNAAE